MNATSSPGLWSSAQHWRDAQSDLAPALASAASVFGALDERLRGRPQGDKLRLALHERDDRIEEARRQTDLKILEIQNFYKFLAVALPPIPPLLVGLIVFVSRRLREREGIAKSRLRS